VTESRIEALVLSDADGNLYEIPCDELLAYRVTAERAAVLERLLAHEEVAGYAFEAFLQFRGQKQGQNKGSATPASPEIPPGSPQPPFGGAIFQVPPVA